MARRRRRHPAVLAAMGAGVFLGLALLSTVRPGQLGARSPVAAPIAPVVERDLTVVRPAPPPPAPTPAPDPEPAPAPLVAVEGPPIDTGQVPQESLVLVDVIDLEGRPTEGARVVPVFCPGFRRGPRGAYIADPGPCTLRAYRRDGALLARGPEATVELVPGEIGYLQLVLASHRTGGIGVRFQAEPSGMRVVDVHPDTPAWRAGLEAGDLIVAVGDQPVLGFTGEEFVELMTGPEGTDVDFTISYATEEGVTEESLRVTRQFLDG